MPISEVIIFVTKVNICLKVCNPAPDAKDNTIKVNLN